MESQSMAETNLKGLYEGLLNIGISASFGMETGLEGSMDISLWKSPGSCIKEAILTIWGLKEEVLFLRPASIFLDGVFLKL